MRIAQLANFIGPASGGMKHAVEALGCGYVEAGAERLLVIPGPVDAVTSTEFGDVVQVRAPRVGSGYRLIVEPWRVIDVLERFSPTSVELSDKLTLLPVARWARRRDVGTVLISHERLDDMFALRTGLDTSAKASIKVLNRLLVRSFDAIVVTSRLRRGRVPRGRRQRRLSGPSGAARRRPRDLPAALLSCRRRHPQARPRRPAVAREVAAPGRLHRGRAAPPRGAGLAGRVRRRPAPRRAGRAGAARRRCGSAASSRAGPS